MLYHLSDLRDPFAFLNGARVPLRSTSGRQTEWIGDDAFYRINDSFEREFLRHWLDDDEERPTGIDEDCARRLSLDLADPDVARWVDRKIAANLAWACGYVPPVTWGEIRLRDGWEVRWGGGHGTRLGLCGVGGVIDTPNDASLIVQARAALVRALFGKVPA